MPQARRYAIYRHFLHKRAHAGPFPRQPALTENRAVLTDYELIISCALGALVILHIINTRRRILRMRERLRSAANPIDVARAPPVANMADVQSLDDLADEAKWRLHDRLIVLLLILALLWFAGRIWLEW